MTDVAKKRSAIVSGSHHESIVSHQGSAIQRDR